VFLLAGNSAGHTASAVFVIDQETISIRHLKLAA
jgi:hypothetical protein